MHFGIGRVGEGRNVVAAEGRIGDPAFGVDHESFVKRGPDRLRDAALDLSAALHRIDDDARIRGVDASQDPDFAVAPMHRDLEALHIEGDRARRAGEWPSSLERRLPRGRRGLAISASAKRAAPAAT